MAESIILVVAARADELQALDGRTFQAHLAGPGKLRLYPVTIEAQGGRCPAVVGGERCGKEAGHEGKHMWARGD